MISAEALWWLPTAAVVAMTALALFAATAQSPRPARSAWLALILICGTLAVAVTAWQQATSHAVFGEETARLRELGSRLDELGRLLPAGPGTTPGETFDTVTAAIVALNAKIRGLDEQIQTLQEKARARTIDPNTAVKFVEYLRQSPRRRVIVSCVPDDVEAHAYANQITNMLREAGWEALGPEKTTIFGEAPGMGIRFYVRGGIAADTAKILQDAFARFNIPYQSGIAPSDANPDPATVELFVSRKS